MSAMDADLSNSLKRCLSVPIINNLPATSSANMATTTTQQQTPKKDNSSMEHRSNPPSREVSPAPMFNIFSTRARRYSASFSPLGAGAIAANANGPRLTPRVSQLRQEECADMNSREVNHEREVHSAMQISQSWEDLTLVAENWSCKSEDVTNPLQVTLPTGITSCSSPSPTSSRAGMRLPYGLSPSPTRRKFATRRSMSPIAMRPSQLGPVKRRFEMDDGNWNYSSPPLKKMFTDSRASSPSCQSPSSVCPSPDSGTYDGRITPKLFISKLCTTNTNSSSSMCSSPIAASPGIDAGIDLQSNASCSPANHNIGSMSEPMCIQLYDGLSDDSAATPKPQDTKSVASDDISDDQKLNDCMSSSQGDSSSSSLIIMKSSDFSEKLSKTPPTEELPLPAETDDISSMQVNEQNNFPLDLTRNNLNIKEQSDINSISNKNGVIGQVTCQNNNNAKQGNVL